MSRTSYTQFTILVEFMETNGDLSKPQGLPNGRQWCLKKWKELFELLNSQGIGESRIEEMLRQVWSDMKNNTKRKWAKINQSVRGTGGGPALKLCLTDLEQRVLSIIGVQAAVGMDIPEIGFSTMEELLETGTYTKSRETSLEDSIIITPTAPIGDEDWNIAGSSKDGGPVPPVWRSITPSTKRPRSLIPLSATPSPLKLPRVSSRQTIQPSPSPPSPPPPSSPSSPPPPSPPSPPQHNRNRKRSSTTIEEYFVRCEANAREGNRERERLFVDLERERIRQHDIELRQREAELVLQAQWLELMKAGLNFLNKYMNEKK